MRAGRIAIGLALGLAMTGKASAQLLCAVATAAVKDRACAANPHGVVLAPEQAEAERIAAAVRDGEARFQRHFGRTPPRYAIVQDFRPGDLAALREAGFARALPWLTQAQFDASAIESLRRGAQAQAEAQGLTAAQAAAAARQAEARWRAMNTPEARVAREAGVLPHEVGHLWYIQLYWPGIPVDRGSHYGGPGPDWLDETAAVLMESDAFAADRRQQFEQAYRGTSALNAIPVDELLDLTRFLTREHPGRSLQESRRGAAGSGPQVQVLVSDQARQAARGGALFYLQGRMFADYLIDRTGDPAIFAEIGAAFGEGRTIEQWLADRGPAHRLPASLAELDRAWRAWLQDRFGPPGAPAS